MISREGIVSDGFVYMFVVSDHYNLEGLQVKVQSMDCISGLNTNKKHEILTMEIVYPLQWSGSWHAKAS